MVNSLIIDELAVAVVLVADAAQHSPYHRHHVLSLSWGQVASGDFHHGVEYSGTIRVLCDRPKSLLPSHQASLHLDVGKF